MGKARLVNALLILICRCFVGASLIGGNHPMGTARILWRILASLKAIAFIALLPVAAAAQEESRYSEVMDALRLLSEDRTGPQDLYLEVTGPWSKEIAIVRIDVLDLNAFITPNTTVDPAEGVVFQTAPGAEIKVLDIQSGNGFTLPENSKIRLRPFPICPDDPRGYCPAPYSTTDGDDTAVKSPSPETYLAPKAMAELFEIMN
jgi:hypothetical protein